jgi:ribosomal protein S27AE
MSEKSRMICPECGVEMRHHAEKIDYSSAIDEAYAFEAELGGVLEEIHSCPECGKTSARRAGAGER